MTKQTTTDEKIYSSTQDFKQNLLEAIETSKKFIEEMSEEELEKISGGSLLGDIGAHVIRHDQFYQKTAAAILVGVTGGVLTAEGVHK